MNDALTVAVSVVGGFFGGGVGGYLGYRATRYQADKAAETSRETLQLDREKFEHEKTKVQTLSLEQRRTDLLERVRKAVQHHWVADLKRLSLESDSYGLEQLSMRIEQLTKDLGNDAPDGFVERDVLDTMTEIGRIENGTSPDLHRTV